MSTEVPQNDVVSFMASIPPSASAIKFDGEANGGGSITLVVSGSDEEGLRRMLLLRGRRFLVTAVLVQTELPLTPAAPDGQEALFPKSAEFSESVSEQVAAFAEQFEGAVQFDPNSFAASLPAEEQARLKAHAAEVARDVVENSGIASESKPRKRKVSRSLVPTVRRKKVGA